ncbi:MAG: hypothetical protein NZO58_13185, partial [Gemmataceae bacterium]|nr:hypothetical protein [Gemmataceae bacterium]
EVALHRNCALGGTVEDWAKRVVQRVTGLLEPLAIIEIDAGKEEAMLRSAQPAKRGDKLFYYEVRLRHLAQATVRRFEASHEPGQKRRQISFTLTHEALAKLVGDIVAV